MVMVAFDITNLTDNAKNLKRNVSETREQHSLKALTTFNNISKSNHNDTYPEKQQENPEESRPQLRETNIMFFSAM